MKHFLLMITTCVLLFAACTYDAPITEEHTIAIDPAVLGMWEAIPEDDEDPGDMERVLVLKFSDTEYLVQHIDGDLVLFFRGYAIEIEGVPAVQLQLIGDNDSPADETEQELFNVVSYGLLDGELVVNVLNTDLVSSELKDSKAIREAFVANKDNEELFGDPTTYRKL